MAFICRRWWHKVARNVGQVPSTVSTHFWPPVAAVAVSHWYFSCGIFPPVDQDRHAETLNLISLQSPIQIYYISISSAYADVGLSPTKCARLDALKRFSFFWCNKNVAVKRRNDREPTSVILARFGLRMLFIWFFVVVEKAARHTFSVLILLKVDGAFGIRVDEWTDTYYNTQSLGWKLFIYI